MLKSHQSHWGVDQWAAYLSTAELPCMPRSKARLLELEAEYQEQLSACHLAHLAGTDPFLCLRLLREAEKRRVKRLEHETTTPLAAVMQLGMQKVHRLILNGPETDENNPGLVACESRSVAASRLATKWGSARADISPEEIAMAALLSEIGELLLWSFVPELPLAAEARLARGDSPRSVQAQVDSCGFRFRDLTLKCAGIWNLPPLLTHLIRGVDHIRANLSRLCVDTARHLHSGGFASRALPSDLAEAGKLIPAASLEWLALQLPGITPEEAALLAAQAEMAGTAAENPPSPAPS